MNRRPGSFYATFGGMTPVGLGVPDSPFGRPLQVLAKDALDGLNSTLVPRDEEHRYLATFICQNLASIDILVQFLCNRGETPTAIHSRCVLVDQENASAVLGTIQQLGKFLNPDVASVAVDRNARIWIEEEVSICWQRTEIPLPIVWAVYEQHTSLADVVPPTSSNRAYVSQSF